jgi:hypothetical protein
MSAWDKLIKMHHDHRTKVDTTSPPVGCVAVPSWRGAAPLPRCIWREAGFARRAGSTILASSTAAATLAVSSHARSAASCYILAMAWLSVGAVPTSKGATWRLGVARDWNAPFMVSGTPRRDRSAATRCPRVEKQAQLLPTSTPPSASSLFYPLATLVEAASAAAAIPKAPPQTRPAPRQARTATGRSGVPSPLSTLQCLPWLGEVVPEGTISPSVTTAATGALALVLELCR